MKRPPLWFPVAALTLAATLHGQTSAPAPNTRTVEPKPFAVKVKFDAVAVPAEPLLVAIDAAEWEDFTIEQIASHGAVVKKGDALVSFKREDFERKLEDARRAAKGAELAAADARTSLAAATALAAIKLEAAQRAASQAAEDLAYFRETRRPAEEEGANERVKRATHGLEAEREELKQLLAMYEADDLTEDTEEFILKRQRDQVDAAEFALKMQKMSCAHTLQVELPRELLGLERAAKEAKIALTAASEETPRSLEAKKLELAAAEAAAKRAAEDLADLEADAAKLTLKASTAGVFYHGAFEDGRWVTGDAVKMLVKGGKISPRRPFATLVPEGTAQHLTAHAEEATATRLRPALTGTCVLAGRDEQNLESKIESVAARPGTDGRYRVDVAVTLPATTPAGGTAKLTFTVHEAADALVLPRKALREGPAGTTQVEVKLADGTTERRTVKPGLAQGDEIQIIEGLEPGQVVVIPE